MIETDDILQLSESDEADARAVARTFAGLLADGFPRAGAGLIQDLLGEIDAAFKSGTSEGIDRMKVAGHSIQVCLAHAGGLADMADEDDPVSSELGDTAGKILEASHLILRAALSRTDSKHWQGCLGAVLGTENALRILAGV